MPQVPVARGAILCAVIRPPHFPDMPRSLIIAEKPSVAADLAKALSRAPGLGRFRKEGDHYESDQALITFARGHLVELKMPMTSEGKPLPWSFRHLPAIPEAFENEWTENARSGASARP